jgi:hypothetical protein
LCCVESGGRTGERARQETTEEESRINSYGTWEEVSFRAGGCCCGLPRRRHPAIARGHEGPGKISNREKKESREQRSNQRSKGRHRPWPSLVAAETHLAGGRRRRAGGEGGRTARGARGGASRRGAPFRPCSLARVAAARVQAQSEVKAILSATGKRGWDDAGWCGGLNWWRCRGFYSWTTAVGSRLTGILSLWSEGQLYLCRLLFLEGECSVARTALGKVTHSFAFYSTLS